MPYSNSFGLCLLALQSPPAKRMAAEVSLGEIEKS